MKLSVFIFLIFAGQQAFAACEASIVEGSHSAMAEAQALAGAWEEAKDTCYPGEAVKLDHNCESGAAGSGPGSSKQVRCVQQASCTLCGDNLVRKYEAED